MAATADPNQKTVRLVVVGDKGVGKTSLLCSIRDGAFPGEYVPGIADSYDVTTHYEGDYYNVVMWDTHGSSEFDHLRILSYPHAHVFVICFSASSPESFDNVTAKWVPEIDQHCPKAPKILLCTKKELREDQATLEHLCTQFARKSISYEEGYELSQHIGAVDYIDTSAKNNSGFKDILFQCIKAALDGPLFPSDPDKRKGGCAIQ